MWFQCQKGIQFNFESLCGKLKKKIFKINGNNYKTKDGTTIRDYIHVQDLARIHLLAANQVLNKKIFKIFNCGYGNGFSVMEILKKFNSISNRKIKFKIGKRRDSDIIISIADPKELVKFTKWKPKFNNLSLIVKSSLNWYKKKIG